MTNSIGISGSLDLSPEQREEYERRYNEILNSKDNRKEFRRLEALNREFILLQKHRVLDLQYDEYDTREVLAILADKLGVIFMQKPDGAVYEKERI